MAKIELKRFDQPDDLEEGPRARVEILNMNGVMVVRSILQPGWNWVEDVQPMTDGLESCPLHHREYVASGRVRYEMVGGETIEAEPGSYLDIPPGHKASVVGDEPAVLVDFDENWG